MATVASATAILVPVYQINSNNIINRSLYPYGMPTVFGTAGMSAQPVSFNQLSDIQAGRQAGGALIYSAITTAAYGSSVFYSNLTVAQIMTLAGFS